MCIRDSAKTPLETKTGKAKRTPARGTAGTEPNSGGASASNPKRASSRSAQRSLGSVSWLSTGLSLAVEQKADSFGTAIGAGSTGGADQADEAKSDTFGFESRRAAINVKCPESVE